jgi:biotin carboxyl carrier protein
MASGAHPPGESELKPRPRMSMRNRLIFLLTGWLIVLMPFLFWWNTWFGRQLSDRQIASYLHDDRHPRHIQHALVQIGERMSQHDPTVARWYGELPRLASYQVEEVRNTDAWVMGQDPSGSGFHGALRSMLADSSLNVRGNAALSLVRFGDASGRPQLRELLQPAKIVSPQPGTMIDAAQTGTAIHQGGTVAKLESGQGHKIEVRSPISGRLREISARIGQPLGAGTLIAIVSPGTAQVWEALRALYLVGQPEDIAAILPYERDLPDTPDQVRQQAIETEKAIRERER